MRKEKGSLKALTRGRKKPKTNRVLPFYFVPLVDGQKGGHLSGGNNSYEGMVFE